MRQANNSETRLHIFFSSVLVRRSAVKLKGHMLYRKSHVQEGAKIFVLDQHLWLIVLLLKIAIFISATERAVRT